MKIINERIRNVYDKTLNPLNENQENVNEINPSFPCGTTWDPIFTSFWLKSHSPNHPS